MAIFSLILFVLARAGTPGPNNTITLASGAAHGFKRTLPTILGVNVGFPVMLLLVGVGLSTAAWTLLGVGAGRVMSTPKHMLTFNLVMAALLVISVIPAITETWRSLPI